MKSRSKAWMALGGVAIMLAIGLMWWQQRVSSFDDLKATVVVPGARNNLANEAGPVVVAIGSFEHPEAINRFPDFPNSLASYLIRPRETNVIFVKRTLEATNATPRPAGWVLNGSYATFGGSQLRVTLHLTRVRGGEKTEVVEGSFAGDLNQKIAQTLRSVVTANDTNSAWYPTRRTEADLHRERGILVSGFNALPIEPFINPYQKDISTAEETARETFRMEQAMVSLESSLRLEPDRAETKIYLGLCYETSFINRTRDARKLYWEVIRAGKQDRFDHRARLRLAKSWVYEDPKQATDLFRTFEEEAPTPEYAAAFRATGSPGPERMVNKKAGTVDALDPLMAQLNDPRRVNLTSIDLGFLFSWLGEGENDAEAKSIAFLHELKPKYGLIYPYLLHEGLRGPLKTNAAAKAEFKQVVETSLVNTQQVARPTVFFDYKLKQAAMSAFETDVEFGMQLMSLCEEAQKKRLREELPDDVKVAKGFGLMKAEQWREALALFEGLGNSVASMNAEGPWNCGDCPISALALAERCRDKLGIASPKAGFHVALTNRFIVTRAPIPTAAFGSNIWLVVTNQLREYTGRGEQFRAMTFTTPQAATCMVVTEDRIYFGTVEDGLVEADRKTFQAKTYRSEDGLLSDSILDLKLIGKKLWIGHGDWEDRRGYYSKKSPGGVGFLDLENGKVSGFSFSKARGAPELARLPSFSSTGNDPNNADSLPPGRPVFDATAGPDGNLYFAADALRRFDMAANRWSATRAYSESNVQAVEGSAEYLCVGQGFMSNQAHIDRPVWIQRRGEKDFRYVSMKDGLPYKEATALLLVKDTLWVGGYGYVAAVSLPEMKITKIYSVRLRMVTNLVRTERSLWIVGETPGLNNAVYVAPL